MVSSKPLPAEPFTALAFDYGEKRTGTAIGNSLTGTAQPLCIVACQQGKPDWQAVADIIKKNTPAVLVVGRPLHLDGTPYDFTERAEKFAKQLHGRYNLPVYLMDERLSSDDAHRQLAEQPRKKGTTANPIDAYAAKLILESWFDQST